MGYAENNISRKLFSESHDSPGPAGAERRNMKKWKSIDILAYMPTGSRNAIKRSRLADLTGLPDRILRKCIHFARGKIPIINLSQGDGYYIPDMNTEEDIKLLVQYVRQEENRVKSIIWSLKSSKQTLRNCGIDWRTYGKEK